MPPSVALSVWFILLLGLLRFDPAKLPETSPALWIPVLYLLIVGSRLPSQWLGVQIYIAAQAVEEGNVLDRFVYSSLMLLAFGILASRAFRFSDFVRQNPLLVSFLLLGLMSTAWSDFPFVSFKRWIRDSGQYLLVLVVLADARPLEAVQTVLRRVCYVLIPLSIVLYKYFPELGMQYDTWSGAAMYVGVTTSKNMLGALCLVGGLFFSWDTFQRWPNRSERVAKRVIMVNAAFIAMTLWLLYLANSATSRLCLALGVAVLGVAHSRLGRRRSSVITGTDSDCSWLVLLAGVRCRHRDHESCGEGSGPRPDSHRTDSYLADSARCERKSACRNRIRSILAGSAPVLDLGAGGNDQ